MTSFLRAPDMQLAPGTPETQGLGPSCNRPGTGLAHPPREPDYRRGRAHDAFVTTLDAHVGGLAAETLEARLRATLDPFDS